MIVHFEVTQHRPEIVSSHTYTCRVLFINYNMFVHCNAVLERLQGSFYEFFKKKKDCL